MPAPALLSLLTSRCPLYSLYSVHLYTVPLHRAYPLRLHRLLLTYLLTYCADHSHNA